MEHFLQVYWPYIATTFAVIATLLASCQIVLQKRDVNAAIGWLGLVLVAPIVGPILYLCFGINRIQRTAKKLRPTEIAVQPSQEILAGNAISPLTSPNVAYTAMLEAIDRAALSISLCEYIFDNDEVGRQFLEALARAKGRGVKINILIDAIGARYSFPRMGPLLKRRGLRTVLFMPSLMPWRFPYFNLRNHRKILVIDGAVGFTGGMNIRSGPTPAHPRKRIIEDLHFRVEGPVVRHLQEAFAQDWLFSTGEILTGPEWFPVLSEKGAIPARGILDGPDADFEKIRWGFMAAIASAKRSITVVTPYFLPDASLISFLCVAALRGVKVRVALPANNNLILIHWATFAHCRSLLEQGVRLYFTGPNFDHSKLMVVDDETVIVGSANWDARSLRLNFEFNLECVDANLARELSVLVEKKLEQSAELTLEGLQSRSLAYQLRDGFVRLMAPYL